MHSWWIVTGKHCTTAECALWSPPTAHTHHPPTHPPTHPHTHSHTPPHTHSLLPPTPPPPHTHTHICTPSHSTTHPTLYTVRPHPAATYPPTHTHHHHHPPILLKPDSPCFSGQSAMQYMQYSLMQQFSFGVLHTTTPLALAHTPFCS